MIALLLETAAAISCGYSDYVVPAGSAPPNTRIFVGRVATVEATLVDQSTGSVVPTSQTTTRGGLYRSPLWLDPIEPLVPGTVYEVELQ